LTLLSVTLDLICYQKSLSKLDIDAFLTTYYLVYNIHYTYYNMHTHTKTYGIVKSIHLNKHLVASNNFMSIISAVFMKWYNKY